MVTWDLSEVSNFFILQHDAVSTDMLGLIQNDPWDAYSHCTHVATRTTAYTFSSHVGGWDLNDTEECFSPKMLKV